MGGYVRYNSPSLENVYMGVMSDTTVPQNRIE